MKNFIKNDKDLMGLAKCKEILRKSDSILESYMHNELVKIANEGSTK